mmetsp:Transcript_32216/g.68775  ORF Transcript_32216/g.68775 Transcript_32216/m.68775 type:complete len:327 (+) Transcript_32216:865-1845(+)
MCSLDLNVRRSLLATLGRSCSLATKRSPNDEDSCCKTAEAQQETKSHGHAAQDIALFLGSLNVLLGALHLVRGHSFVDLRDDQLLVAVLADVLTDSVRQKVGLVSAPTLAVLNGTTFDPENSCIGGGLGKELRDDRDRRLSTGPIDQRSIDAEGIPSLHERGFLQRQVRLRNPRLTDCQQVGATTSIGVLNIDSAILVGLSLDIYLIFVHALLLSPAIEVVHGGSCRVIPDDVDSRRITFVQVQHGCCDFGNSERLFGAVFAVGGAQHGLPKWIQSDPLHHGNAKQAEATHRQQTEGGCAGGDLGHHDEDEGEGEGSNKNEVTRTS